MNYWIFVANYWKLSDGQSVPSRDIIDMRTSDRFWGLGEKTPNRRALAKGDYVVFYAGGGDSQVFMATARLASACYKLTAQQMERVSHEREEYRAPYGVDLDDVEVWSVPKLAKPLVPHLAFIQNKEFWGVYLQGGVRSVSADDYRVITEGGSLDLVQQIARQVDLESTGQFALEQHLEEFIEANWENIDFGAPLALYEAEGQTGRQFPAGPPASNWSIDFLALDKRTNDLVVIELKRGRSSDSVAGQVLRYMTWVRENIAAGGQHVRGLVIGKDVDDTLRYALKGQAVDVKTYEVRFALMDSS